MPLSPTLILALSMWMRVGGDARLPVEGERVLGAIDGHDDGVCGKDAPIREPIVQRRPDQHNEIRTRRHHLQLRHGPDEPRTAGRAPY
jgi:hypothetical protein